MNKEDIYGSEFLEFINPDTLEEIKKKGFEISMIIDGFKVYLKKIGEDGGDEEEGFGEDVDEAVYNALPI